MKRLRHFSRWLSNIAWSLLIGSMHWALMSWLWSRYASLYAFFPLLDLHLNYYFCLFGRHITDDVLQESAFIFQCLDFLLSLLYFSLNSQVLCVTDIDLARTTYFSEQESLLGRKLLVLLLFIVWRMFVLVVTVNHLNLGLVGLGRRTQGGESRENAGMVTMEHRSTGSFFNDKIYRDSGSIDKRSKKDLILAHLHIEEH